MPTRPDQPVIGKDESGAVSDLRIALSDARALNQVARAMIAHPDLGVLLQTVVNTVAEALPAERVSLITFDLAGRRIEHFVRGGPGAAEIALSVGFDELTHGLSGWVLREGRPALSPAATPDPRELPDVQQRRKDTRCGDIIVVPLTYLDRIVGTMTAINPPDGATFSGRQVELMMAMASHAAIAINTATLYDRLTAKTAELSRSLEVEVAARRRAEEAESKLAASRAQLEFALRSHALGAWSIDLSDRRTTHTLTHDQIFGYESPVAEWNWSRFMHHVLPKDRALVQQTFDHAVATQGDWSIEFRIRRVDGAIRNVFLTGMQHPVDQGGAGMQGLLQDVTERKRALELQQQMSALIESAADAIVTKNLEGVVQSWNPAAELLFGYPADAVIGKDPPAWFPADRLDEETVIFRELARDVPIPHRETTRRRRDGVLIDISLSVSPIRDRAGSVVGASMIMRDITERTRSAEQLRLALEAAPTGMLMVDRDGTMVMVNARIESLFGYARDELIGRSIDLLVPAASRGRHSADRGAFQAQPAARTMGRDVHGLHKDGREIPLEVGLSPIHTSHGDFVIGSVMDISGRIEVDRMRRQFISSVSHELRTPLTSIAGSLGLLHAAMLDGIPANARRMIDIAHHNSARLVRIINDVLDVGKLESGQFSLRIATVRLADTLREAVDVTASFAAQFGVRLSLEPPAEAAAVFADGDRLMQVLTNLLSNAIKFSANDSEVRLRALASGDRWRVEVQDFGVGIPEEFRARIFTKFAQADASPARRTQGTGLGLHIAQQLITLMGGTIDYTSIPGRGTTFHFDLPAADDARR